MVGGFREFTETPGASSALALRSMLRAVRLSCLRRIGTVSDVEQVKEVESDEMDDSELGEYDRT